MEGERLGHFQLEEFIGGGGMGAVFRAEDTSLGRTVAVKVVSSERTDEETLRRFRNEAQSAARLDHPNIARVYYVGAERGWHYIVFEYIEGVNVRDLVAHKGPLPVAEAISYTVQVAEALAHAAGRDVVHRDIKPSNILVMSDGRAKLVDMGLARLHQVGAADNELTATGVTLGTFDYISPEQARDPRSADIRSDLYSLGCTLYFMLTGLPPFPEGTVLQKLLSHSSETPPDPREIRHDLEDEVAAVSLKLMAKQPGQRYQSAHELIVDVLVLAKQMGIPGILSAGRVAFTPRETWFSGLEKHLPWMVAVSLFLIAALTLNAIWPRPEAVPVEAMGPRPSPRPLRSDAIEPLAPVAQSEQQSSSDQAGRAAEEESVERESSDENLERSDDTATEASQDDPAEQTDSSSPSRSDSSSEREDESSRDAPEPDLDIHGPMPPHPEPSSETSSDDADENSEDENGVKAEGDTESSAPSVPIVVVTDSMDVSPNEIVVNSLQAALQQLRDRPQLKTIELRLQQLVEDPLRLNLDRDRELTIRAAEGYDPLIIFRPSTSTLTTERKMFKLMGGKVKFVGMHFLLELPYEFPQADWSLFDLNEVREISLARSTLTLRSHFDSAASFFTVQGPARSDVPVENGQMIQATSPHIKLDASVVRGQASLVRAEEGLPFALSWTQGLFASSKGMIETGGLHLNSSAEIIDVELSHVTAAMDRGLVRVAVTDGQPVIPAVDVDCQNCVISHKSDYPLISHVGVDSLDELSMIESRLKYGGRENVYEATQVFWRVQTRDNAVRNVIWDNRHQPWYNESITERQLIWEDPYAERPRIDAQTPQDFLLGERQRSFAGFDVSQLPTPVEPLEEPVAESPDAGPSSTMP